MQYFQRIDTCRPPRRNPTGEYHHRREHLRNGVLKLIVKEAEKMARAEICGIPTQSPTPNQWDYY